MVRGIHARGEIGRRNWMRELNAACPAFHHPRMHAQGKTQEDRQIKTERDPEEAGDGMLDEKAALEQFPHADPGLERSWKDVRTPTA